MDRMKAKEEARKRQNTWGDLRSRVRMAYLEVTPGEISKVNSQLTREYSLGLLENAISEQIRRKGETAIPDAPTEINVLHETGQ